MIEKQPLKGETRVIANKLYFSPREIRLNLNDSVVLIYGRKGCLIATVPGHRANESFRKSNNGTNRPLQAQRVYSKDLDSNNA